jgi:acyl-homoserine-lactone acylase
VTITRDDWGVAHVRAATDAEAVFGMVYAQAEDDFRRVETNYLVALGRLAQVEGEKALWQDLRQRLYVQDDALRAAYSTSPPWLQKIMDAWSGGLDCYLASHPEVHPRLLTRFEPWMALSFTEGSIGGDIERISLSDLAAFYGREPRAQSDAGERAIAELQDERSASNGIAIAPSRTASRHPLLLINPHTSFFFRSELHVTSDEGLDAYGAVTWGQPFVYQGFNARVGFMHTSSGVDAVDEFAETIVLRGGVRHYRYGSEERPLGTVTIDVPYRTERDDLASRRFTTYRTHHGPIVRADGDAWISFAMMDRPVLALEQSFLRTKARSFDEFRRAGDLRANSSNNTVYADADGVIAYLHPQFVPRRDDRFDYRRPVAGSDPATDWKGEHAPSELPMVVSPSVGWIQNTNDWPFSAAGKDSPARERFPRYVDTHGENPRGLHAVGLLEDKREFTTERLLAAAYDSLMPAFARMVPALVAAYDAAPASPKKTRLAEPVAELRAWDFRWGAGSVATTLAVTWGEEVIRRCASADSSGGSAAAFACAWSGAPAGQPLDSLAAATDRLEHELGTWRTPWGDVSRFQRRTGDLVQAFADDAPSTPVPFTPGAWGSLASFSTVTPPGSHKRYGTSGNSFVSIVELAPDGPRAVAVTAGGESGDPRSAHFADQVERYASGRLRPVYFRPDDLAGHMERVYRPGQR